MSPKILAKGTNNLSPSDQILAQTLLQYLNFLTSNIQEVDDPTLVTLLKMQPYDRLAACIVNPVVKMQPHTAKKYINWPRVKKN